MTETGTTFPFEESIGVARDRFLSLLKPPPAVFTQEIPANVLENPMVIALALMALRMTGCTIPDGNTPTETRLFETIAAREFITAVMRERPDVVYSMATGDLNLAARGEQ
ncbi:hypothetical protein BC939DRAFT_475637 [Gamsiella multidivaricata]|uniref:uncharacterized protein n=1 Tax=Gamsiella multidivaricata TaxID=101098 RepID=UPI00221E8512|nr:uncharacterized protein BC939DRAFT_475637 [Gamsiella multidivaricata]KAI7826959.1 hypothetical protein BC939DRAFT_475637 [Gamsiella multidivaricata]